MTRRGVVPGRAQSREQYLCQSLVVIANHHACHLSLIVLYFPDSVGHKTVSATHKQNNPRAVCRKEPFKAT
jgi:hypothetical protein